MALDRTTPGLSFQTRAEIDKYLAAYAKDPRSRVFAALAEAYRRAGMLEEAIKVAEDGLRSHPNLPSALITLGRAYFESGNPAKARPLLERIAQQSPDNLTAQRALAELYFQAGETPLARAAYQAILRANPADPEAQTRLKALPAAPAAPPAPLGARVPSPAIPPQPIAPPAPAQEMTQAAPAAAIQALQPSAPAPGPPGAAPPVSDREKINLFFESVDVTTPAPEAAGQNYQVKSASEIFSDLEDEKKRSPITTETLARLLLRQGYTDKARAIFEEILAGDPSRRDLASEVARLRQEQGLPPLDLSTLTRKEPPRPPASPAPVKARVTSGPRVTPPAPPPPPAPIKPPPVPSGAQVALGARVPVRLSSTLRLRPEGSSQPKASPANPPPGKAEKIEALKGILEQIKKGKKP